MTKLRRLIEKLPEIQVKGSKEVEVTGMCAFSKWVVPNNLFVAKRGSTFDGNLFIPDAIEAGASAVLTDLYDPFLKVTQLIHPDVHEMEKKLAALIYDSPSSKLEVIGITGTNGKTTTSYLIKHLLDKGGIPSGLIGSIEWIAGEHRYPSKLTCPDLITNQKLLKEMVDIGCKAAVMEVSSHGLDQGRTDEIDFSLAIFTNLSQDHLDYHHTMEHYLGAKEKLFASLKPGKSAIVNRDDPAFAAIAASSSGKVSTYGIDQVADLQAKDIRLSQKGMTFTVCHEGKEVRCSAHLIGRFNIYNLLAALSAALHFGISLEDACEFAKSFTRVSGRLEPVSNRLGLKIFVDHAHTDHALANVLGALREVNKGKLITVFGCGGDRDRQKRWKMGSVVSHLSDEAILTNDNPRTEDPHRIAEEILEGVRSDFPLTVELDRKKAIEAAIERAGPADTLLIAGKGHETEQILAHQVIPFSDKEVAKEACRRKELAHQCG